MIVKYIERYYSKFKGLYKRITNRNICSSTYIANGVQILGLDNVEIGRNSTISENTMITINNRNKQLKLQIGNDVYIGRDNFFTIGNSSKIGDYCIVGNKCSFICSNHIFDNPLIPYSLSGATSDMSIIIGVNCWLGYNVSVIGNVTIGHGSIIGANSVVLKSIPPFSIAVGNPARVIKRFNFKSSVWEKTQHIEDTPFLNEEFYREYLNKNNGDVPIAYHSSSSKFGDI